MAEQKEFKNIFDDLIGERILVINKQFGFNSKTEIEELKILEVSPSKHYVKVQNIYGNKIWKSVNDITAVEILAKLEKHPNNNK